MSAEILAITIPAAAATACVVWLEIKSCRNSRRGDEGPAQRRDD